MTTTRKPKARPESETLDVRGWLRQDHMVASPADVVAAQEFFSDWLSAGIIVPRERLIAALAALLHAHTGRSKERAR